MFLGLSLGSSPCLSERQGHDMTHFSQLCFFHIDIYTSEEVILACPYRYWAETDKGMLFDIANCCLEVSIFAPLTLKVLKTISSEVNVHLLI